MALRTTTDPAGLRVEIALLGGWSARIAGRSIQLPTKKSQALLAYLALRVGRIHDRETLHALLWPESPKPQAQASLRQALLALRKTLPPALQGSLQLNSNQVALDPACVRVDVEVAERLLTESTRAALEGAAALFQGPLLDGFTLTEAPFEEWLAAERTRLNDVMINALERLAELQAREGSLERAVETALQALRLEPLEERAHRSIMRLYALQGRRAEAIRHYEQCAAMLARELGVEPDQQTKRLHRELLCAEGGSAPTPPAPALEARTALARGPDGPSQPSFLPPLVGRELELAWLERVLGAAGETRLAALHGDAGVGKTRLLTALAERVRARGNRCVRGRCFESEQVLPFALWVDLLRSDASLIEETALRGLPSAYQNELARLLPEVAGEPAPALADARLLFEAVGELLARAAKQHPLVVLLEDLHWADGMSLRLLSFLVRRAPPGAHLRVVGTVRAEELAAAPDLRRVLHELEREQRLCELTLTPLARADALSLVRALWPAARGAPDARAGERIWALSAGNPLVIVEGVRSPDVEAAGEYELPVPERVHKLIMHQVDRLTPPARDALATAAVIEREFDFALLARACGAELRALADSAEELVQRRLLADTGTGFHFTHDRIREVLYAQLSPARRRVLHGAVARALEALYFDRLDDVAGTIGYHYAHAAEAEASVVFLLRFAQRCARNYGLEEALAALEEAQRQSRGLPERARDVRALELAIHRCDCLMHLGRAADVEATLAPFQANLDRLGLPALTAPFHAWLGLAKSFVGEATAAVEHGTRALAEAERCGDLRTAGLAHSLISLEASRSGPFQTGVAHGRRAVAMLDPDTTDHEFAAFAHMHLGFNYLSIGECWSALESFTHAHAIGARVHSARLQCIALALMGVSQVCAAEFDVGLPACRQAVELAPDPHSAWLSRLTLVRAFTLTAFARGQTELLREPVYAASIQALEASLSDSGNPSMRAFAGRAMIALADAYLARGEAERARHMANSALPQLHAVDDLMGIAAAHRVQGQAELASGNLGQAAERISEARRSFDGMGARLEGALTGLAVALIAMLRGDWASSTRELERTEQTLAALALPRWVALVRERFPRRAP